VRDRPVYWKGSHSPLILWIDNHKKKTAYKYASTLRKQFAKAAFPKGNIWITMRDELGVLSHDDFFTNLFPNDGQPAIAPW
jgi:hypothetical protein